MPPEDVARASRLTNEAEQKWRIAIRRQRNKWLFLNYFTVNQMMRLCRTAEASNEAAILRALRYVTPDIPASAAPQLIATLRAPTRSISELQRSRSYLSSKLVKEGAWEEGIGLVENLGRALQEVLGDAPPRMRWLQPLEGEAELEKDEALLQQGRGAVVTGLPNSVVVSAREDVMSTVIALYAQEGRVPEPSEVLLCNDRTSAEDVELLLLRCGAHKEDAKRLFTIVRGELLGSETQNSMLDGIKDLSQTKRLGRLVVITTSAGQDRGSRLSDTFAKYQISVASIRDASLIEKVGMLFPAEQAAVQAVSSELVGCGKTYHIYKESTARHLAVVPVPVYSATYSTALLGCLKDKAGVGPSSVQVEVEGATTIEGRALHLMLSPTVGSDVDAQLFQLLVLQA